jgi:opacity protein-like surface antigen
MAVVTALPLTSSGARAQDSELVQIHALVKRLEARVVALEEQTDHFRRDAEQAKSELRALRQKRPAEPLANGGSAKPTAVSDAYAMPTKAPVVRYAASNAPPLDPWSGPYWGASFGGALTRSRVTSQENSATSAPLIPALFENFVASEGSGVRSIGATIDLFAGLNMRVGAYLLAGLQIEGTLADTDFSVDGTRATTISINGLPAGTTSSGTFRPRLHSRSMASALGRVGVLVDPSTLMYAIAGLTAAQFEYQDDLRTNLTIDRVWGLGASVGGGIEHKIDQNWSVRGEYRYTRFRSTDVSGNSLITTLNGGVVTNIDTDSIQARFNNEMHVGRIGIAYQPSRN